MENKKEHSNKVRLVGYYGSDEIIACSAWISTSNELTEEKKNRIPQMIARLWSDGHGTPFEKGIVHFIVNSDIASHIHLLKHRISSLNGESGRYKELKDDKYYIPEDWGGIKLSNNVGEVGDSNIGYEGEDWTKILQRYTELGNQLYHQCLNDLQPILGRKRAKESARYFKTYAMQYEVDLMFNMRSFANFLKLRDSEHAQKEIQEIAHTMAELILSIPDNSFKNTMKAFGYE